MLISLDCEATGLDWAHGMMPFLVTTCSDDGVTRFWEWDVCPTTRCPDIPLQDIADIIELIDAADLIYMHNGKYDAHMLRAIGIQLPWSKVRDTLAASHLLASNHGHSLDELCVEYLGVDIGKYELVIKAVTRECRAIVRRDFPSWRLADEDIEDMPSVKSSSKRDEDKPWKNDMWLPSALANYLVTNGLSYEQEINPSWMEACARYANADSEHTLYLGIELERQIRERGLWKIYEHRLHLPRIACEMEEYGVTAVGDYTLSTIQRFEEYVAESEAALVDIAAGYGHELKLAKGAALNDNMREFFYGSVRQTCPICYHEKVVKHWNGEEANGAVCPKCAKGTKRRPGVQVHMTASRRENLALPPIWSKKTGNPTLDKDAMQDYLATTEGTAYDFIQLLSDKRNYDTALSYMHGYTRFWVPTGVPGYYRIHASLNPFATDHLRWASNSPNMQNVSGESKEISNRACFGPMPEREWWKMDYKSIEARIPTYESGEPKMVEVFEQPNKPPYWGNLYLLTASVLYPNEFWPCAEVEGAFRKAHPRLYKRAKFFVLAKQYGCGPRKGDLLSGVFGSFGMVDNEFPLLAQLQAKYLNMAEKLGYVETLPDRTVDPERGYPILASRTDDGRVLSTTPFNYHVSGTACWCKNTAIVRCAEQCRRWQQEGFDAHIALEVHDELLIDFPRGDSMETNLPRVMVLKQLMEQSGEDLIPRIPTPVSVEYCVKSWADGVVI